MQRQASKERSGLDATVECHVAFKKIKIWLGFCFLEFTLSQVERKIKEKREKRKEKREKRKEKGIQVQNPKDLLLIFVKIQMVCSGKHPKNAVVWVRQWNAI